jgi:O-antigen/teichoic acid export membrane protein
MSVGVNLVTQVLIARYLTTTDFGAFAYALSMVTLVGGLVGLGFDRGISRFLPIYDENRDFPRFFGTLFLVVGIIVGLGATAILVVIGLQGWLVGRIASDPLAVSILVLMIALAPIEALDGMLTDLFAVFRATRTIFVRKYLLAPGLRLLVVAVLIATANEVEFLATGYVLAGAAGVALYATMLPGMLRGAGVLGRFNLRSIRVPLREVASYTVPLLTLDIVLLFMSSLDTIIVGSVHGSAEVAELRVVDSTARMNSLVFTTFSIMFVPAAARFFARGDRVSMRDLYWRTAAWMAVLSFPIFALTFSLAEPVTVALFDERYRSSGIILAILSLARYIDAAFGANGQTIRIFGGIKETVLINLATAGIHLVLAVLLIPRFEALGAAVAILLTYIVFNVLKQLTLRRVAGVPAFDTAYLSVYGAIVAGAAVIALFEVTINPPLWAALALAGIGSLAVLGFGRRVLRIGETFPELLRFPGARFLR